MIYKIFENGDEINRIIADSEFVENYCAENGYTYEVEPEPDIETEPTAEEILYAMLGVSRYE